MSDPFGPDDGLPFGPDDGLGFEPVDEELRQRLGAAAPGRDVTNDPLWSLRPRYRRARTRHRAVLAAGSAFAVAALVGVGSLAISAGDPQSSGVRIPPAGSTADGPATTAPGPATTSTTPIGPTATNDSVPGATGTTAAPVTPPAGPFTPDQRTFDSAGGSVTVRLDGNALSIVSTRPAAGFTEERHDSGPDVVEVRFRNAAGVEWRIKVEGDLQAEVTLH